MKPAEELYAHRKMADGRLNHCKECVRSRVNKYRRDNLSKVHEYDVARSKSPHRAKKAHARAVERRKRDPRKYLARTAVGNAVRDGRLVKGPCFRCGSTSGIEAHHDDYSKPLEVRWVCFKCHRTIEHGQVVTSTWIRS